MKSAILVLSLIVLAGAALGQTTDEQITAVTAKPAMKSGSTALLYSLLLPGGGQFYNGDVGKGLIQAGATALGLLLFAINFPSEEFVRDEYYWASYGYWTESGNEALCYGGLALALAARVWSIIDAPQGAKRFNQRHGLVSLPVDNDRMYVSLDNLKINSRNTLGLRIGFTL